MWAEVEEEPKDNWVSLRAPIFSLKARGEGTTRKSKRQKVDFGKSMSIKESSTRPLMVGPFESLANELRVVQHLVKNLPQGSSEAYREPHSFIPQKTLDVYLEDHRKKKAQLSCLDKAYANMVKSHSELSRSHDKMKKREDKKDKFFTRMWKGVKGLGKVLKAKEPLLSSRPDQSEDVPAIWSDDDDAYDEDSEATKSEDDELCTPRSPSYSLYDFYVCTCGHCTILS